MIRKTQIVSVEFFGKWSTKKQASQRSLACFLCLPYRELCQLHGLFLGETVFFVEAIDTASSFGKFLTSSIKRMAF